ncbi:zinc finger protein 469 [Gopherus flavomarginatus]|uniref:zinc finger protein 469 n=1 Tax=Gopherus flavomarginatus TaxID=286002 RepID=UPI0021CC073A|nr:zinc finger protein 469 [Gopherus flavomarginatus]
MTGETQHVYAVSDTESSSKDQDKDFAFERFSGKGGGEFNGSSLDTSELCLHNGTESGSHFPNVKDKEPHSQREAVIRPQQAGKIDFKSLHNKPKFSSNGSWGSVMGSPQSPTGKSRVRDKNRRSGKAERSHHQLYRLSISNSRSNPTIGIAYPQQKVTPPKKPEISRGPSLGSYRFHVPSIPEREAELKQEDLSFNQCFPEVSSSLTSGNYTSHTPAAARQNQSGKGQPSAGLSHKNPGTNGQLHYLEFQANGNKSWPSPDKNFPGASYGISAQKPYPFPESGKASTHCLGSLPFQYPFQPLHDVAKDPFHNDTTSQDYMDVSLATNQVIHGAFGFHSSSRDWQDEALGNGSYETVAPEGRTYGLSSQPAQFLHSSAPGVQQQSPLPCYKGRNEHSGELSGALSSSGAIDQTPSTFQENQSVFPPSLHATSMPKPVSKGQPSLKDNGPSQRILTQGSSLRRNMPQNSLPQVHFQNKVYCGSPVSSVSPGSVPFEKSMPSAPQAHPRLLQTWDGANKAFSPVDQTSAPYSNPVGSQFSFECQSSPEQRQHVQKNSRMPWQQIHLTSAVPSQDRIELSRQLTSQKFPFPLGTSQWPGGSSLQKGTPRYHSQKLLAGEGLLVQRRDPTRQSCGSTNAFSFDGGKDTGSPTCGSRSKPLFFSMNQTVPPATSRSSPNPTLALPPSALVAASPCESPLPSPVPNPTCSSTCSSLSPMSSSPVNHNFEDSQLSAALTPAPFFHHPCHPADILNSSSLHYHPPDSIKPFHFPLDTPKDEHLLKCLPETQFHKPDVDMAKSCLDAFEGEPPPPPYSSHHLLANSLSSASLDQLDVLLTCKQCDQNYSNLSSFLEHRQFCSSHVAFQGEMRDASKGAEARKQLPLESTKHSQARPGPSLSPDTHSHLLALNKPVNFPLDGEGRGEAKEDPLKGHIFHGLTTNSLPLTASDLEIDDAKLDSLITEALNGLEYQSDNPEIDSSFIDVFADEELTSVKGTGSGMPHKVKDDPASENKLKHAGKDKKPASQSKAICYYEEDHPSGEQAQSRTPGTQHVPKRRLAGKFTDRGNKRLEKSSVKELAQSKAANRVTTDKAQPDKNTKLKTGRKGDGGSVTPVTMTQPDSDKNQPRSLSEDAYLKSEIRPSGTTPGPANKNPKLLRFPMKDVKKRKPRSGTWSKELIHKIVQQKNKLHKLHAKSDKNTPVSRATEKLLPAAQDSKFGEYEYISDSDDEGVVYAKLHSRKKLGSASNGRTKHSFSKRCSGRGERTKEKEPTWTYSQKRDGQEHRRAPSNEAIKKDGIAARIRRRSSRSSTGSSHSTSLSSETGASPPSTERADSDNENESVQNRRYPDSSEHITPLPRNSLSLLDKETLKMSNETKVGFSRGTRRFGSAKYLLTASTTHRSDRSCISPAGSMNEENSPESKEKQHHSRDAFNKGPIRLYCEEDTEEQKGATSHAGEIARPKPGAQDSTDLTMTSQRRPFAAYNEDTLTYNTEELIPPSHIGIDASPGQVSATYSPAGIKYLKEHGLCDDPKDYAAPVGCYNGDPVGVMLAIKGPDTYVSTDDTLYDHKDLSSRYDPNLFSKPPAVGASHINNMYLCQDDISTSSFEQKHSDFTPFASENQQTKVSSPLGFDSSSIFGELPVAEFDTPLYGSVATSKDNYVPFGCNPPSKTMPFEQQYPPFLQEKDWGLMEEVSPILSEDIGQFHTLSVEKPLAKKFPDEGAITHNQMSLPLADRIVDYNVAFMNNISDDELEIKRLVTELESQLQTSKLNNEPSEVRQTSEQHTGTQLRKATDQFSPIHVDQETGNEKDLFLTDALGNTNLLSTKVCVGQSLVNEKPTVPNIDGNYKNHQDSWLCPAEFSSLESSMCTPAAEDSISVDHFCSKEACDKLPEALKDAETSKESDSREMENEPSQVIPDSCMPDKLEAPIYTNHMIKSPAIVTDSLFPKTLEAAELNKHDIFPSLPGKHGADGFSEPGKMDKTFDDPPELESFSSHIPNLKSEFGFQEDRVPTLDLALSSHAKNDMDSEESPLDKAESPKVLKISLHFEGDDNGSVLLEETEESKDPEVYQTPGPFDKASNQKALLFDILSVSKETDCGSEKVLASQETTANPLQQLQLFVARTVKNNEEELMMPCFPVLLSANHQPSNANIQSEQEEEGLGSLEGENSVCHHACIEGSKPMEGEAESMATTSEETGVFAEAGEQLESFNETDTYTAEQSTFANHKLHNNVTELQHLADECSEPSDINICADGVSQEHNNLSACSSATVTPLLGQVRKADQIVEEQEQDKNKATLAFKNHRQSYLNHSLFEKETLSNALTETLKVSAAEGNAWSEGASHQMQLSCTIKTKCIGSTNNQVGHETQLPCSACLGPASSLNPSEDLHQEYNLLHETNICSVNAQLPEDGNGEKKQVLDACHSKEDSLASLPLQTSFSHHRYLQNSNNENVEFSDFSVQLSGEDRYTAPVLNTETQSSSFIVKRFNSDSEKNLVCCSTQNPLEQGKWKDTRVFQPTLQQCNTTAPAPLDAIGNIRHCPAKDILTNFEQSEKEGPAEPHVPQCPGELAVSGLELESPQKLQMNDCILPCMPPLEQNDIGDGLLESTCAELLCPLYKGSKTCTVTETIINSQSMPLQGIHACQPTPETKDYSMQPTNLSPVGERDGEVNLNQEKELKKCHYNGNKHQNEPEASCNSFVMQQIPTIVSTACKRTADSGPVDQEVHRFTEVPEMIPSDPSKNVDNRENNSKGDDLESHGAESTGGDSSCMLYNMEQEEESGMFKNMPNASRNGHLKEKKQNGLQVTCDICSASFRSKPGLTRHKAVKHRTKNDGTLMPSKTSKFSLNLLEKTSKMSKKVSRKSIKATAKERMNSTQMPTSAIGHVSKKTCAGQEKEPNPQMQEVVSRVLSDLSVISLEVCHERHHTDILRKETKTKCQSSETGELDESVTEKPGLKKQPNKRGKGRRSQSKDPGGINRNLEKKQSRKARREVNMFPNESEVNGLSNLEKNAADGPSNVLSSRINSSLSNVIEDLAEPGSCISAEEQDRSCSPQQSHTAKRSPCIVKHADEVGDLVVSSMETDKQESLKVPVSCQKQMEDPSQGEKAPAKEKWASGFMKQVEKGLSKVCKEQHDGGVGTNVKEHENSLGESNHGNHSSAFRHPLSPARPDLSLETCESETANRDPTKGMLENASDDSPFSAESKPWGKGELLQRKESCTGDATEPDLQGLFDDDVTFAQLFPRDNQFTRRKCTRVYGKRTKKPKPVTDTNVRPVGAIDFFPIRLASDLSETSSFCVTRDDPCEYETISIDDALMLNMCHSSKPKGCDASSNASTNIALQPDYEKNSQRKEVIDLEDDNMLTFLCQNNQMENIPNMNIWGSLEKEAENLPADDVLFKSPTELENEHSIAETSPEPPELEEEHFNSKINEDQGSPEFHTIDIEMLSAKFKMQDMCFFSPCKDNPGHLDESMVCFKQKPSQHSKHSKNKLEDGKPGKNRNDMNIKTKDKQYKCKVCFQWFLTLGELDFHKLTHNPSPPPTCYMCVQRKFSSREQLRDHLKEKHAKNKAGLWACGMCLKEISDVWMYNEHLREHATQFARKGQAQKSAMGLPTCFSEDNAAVTHFLNTIMYRKPSKSSKLVDSTSKHLASKENKSLKEPPPDQEAKVTKDTLESSVRIKLTSSTSSSSKGPASPSPGNMPKGESTQKAVPMHPDCKDPSRDCHHCGKQFPKPFKLQRHLVVHSLQKIYLCHKCPMFYLETKELRSHLSQDHGIAEEPEIKHTTLYACELCADVMHVIKKSFICSMCNYTFSKKEQYDRHMEKHLAGSNKTFKFRGVMRPGISSKDGNEKIKEENYPRMDMPPRKKRKLTHHGSLDPHNSPVHFDHSNELQLADVPLPPPSESCPETSDDPGATLPQTSVKTEDLVGDFSDLLDEMEKSQFDTLPPPPCLSPLPQAVVSDPELSYTTMLSIEELDKGAFDGKPLPFLDSSEFRMDLANLAHNQAMDGKLSPPHLTEKHGHADGQAKPTTGNQREHVVRILDNPSSREEPVEEIPFLKLAKKIPEISAPKVEAPLAKDAHKTLWSSPNIDGAPREIASKANYSESAYPSLPLKDKTASPVLNRAAKDSAPQKKTTGSQVSGEAPSAATDNLGSTEEIQKSCSLKEKAMPETGVCAKDGNANASVREIGCNQNRFSSQLKDEGVANAVKHSHSDPGKSLDKPALNGPGKLHPKKRKEHKSSGHRGSSASRENIEGDGKKKKARTPGPGRSDGAGELKRAEWTNEASALSPGKREMHCNKLIPKPKMSGVGNQLKKMALDTYNQKKVTNRHSNGDLKRKKDILGKTFHHLLAKGPTTSFHSSLNRHRAVQGAKPADSHNYRTAESQNNLLSQLFGQKLTSFKIPLRRDTSE